MDIKYTSINKAQSQSLPDENEQKVNSAPNPYLSRFLAKMTPIGFQYHQIQVPEWVPGAVNTSSHLQQLEKLKRSPRLQPTFLASQIEDKQLEQYLTFAQNYFEEKITDYFGQGLGSRQRMRAKAMEFLHKMEYNYTRAKFYILFPYYLRYNSYRCHDPLTISVEDMDKKIKDHLDGLKNTKQKQMQRWIDHLQLALQNRTTLAKIVAIIDNGKQNKYEIPQNIKQQIEKAQKAGKQLKKSLQGSKLPIDILLEKKQMLQEHKIVTSEMINFQDTVLRCQQWLKKQQIFNQKYLQVDQQGSYSIKPSIQKIQFRVIQLLVNQYSNLPVLQKNFEEKTKLLYQQTVQLLQKMPTLSKAVKTRTSKQQIISKIPYDQIRQYLTKIQKYPVSHEDFVVFQVNMRQSLQLLERVNMFLQDTLSQKNSKILNNYIKLVSDIQIENNIEKRLRIRLQYNDIMDRIKKQLSNPGKVQSIKDALNKLKEKGIREVQDSGYQQKIMLYLGWYESQQRLKQTKFIPNNLELIQKQLDIKKKMVNAQGFRDQLESAKKQLSISQESLEEAYRKLNDCKKNQQRINQMLASQNPQIQQLITMLKTCIAEGLTFPEFEQLYDQTIKYFTIIAKIHYLLKYRQQNSTESYLTQQQEHQLFFQEAQCDYIIQMIVFQHEMKDLRSKQGAQKLLHIINNQPFPVYLKECQYFRQFMKNGQQWEQQVMLMIKDFREKGESVDFNYLQDTRYYLHCKVIFDELNKIQFIMRWRQKISKKFDDQKPTIFGEQEEQFIVKLEKDLMNYQALQFNTPVTTQKNNISSPFKFHYLQYSKDNQKKIKKILNIIMDDAILQNVCKLSQMNKFYREIQKQIERHKIDDKKIFKLKQQFREEIFLADDWKERFLIVKRFQKKKMLKKETMNADDQIGVDQDAQQERNGLFAQGGISNQFTPDHNITPKKKYLIRNPGFTWYFKFLIMILEFCKGYKLKFCLQELLKLKNSLIEVNKFIISYDKLMSRSDPVDLQLVHLQTEYAKIPIFIREYWLLSKKNAYVQSWKILADSVLQSVPIVNMELKARKQSQLIAVLAKKKQQTQQANKQMTEQRLPQEFPHKRPRKPNTLYINDDITLLTDENVLGPKSKKRRKGQNPINVDTEYRNTSVACQNKKSQKNQLEQLERAEALLKNNQLLPSLLFDEQAIKQYCICRNGELNENSTMVQCEGKCGEWYHIECIGIKKHQTKGDYSYLCIGCITLYEGQFEQRIAGRQQGSFYWDYHRKITDYAFNEIVNEGKNLGVYTQQLKKIVIVHDKMVEWKQSVDETIQQIVRDDFMGKPLDTYADKLYELYLLSIWLPTFHPEAYTVKKLLLIHKQTTA